MAWQIIEIAVRKASLFIRASSLFLRPSSFRASACWRAPSLTAPAKYVAHSRAPPFNALACSTAACNNGGSSAAIAQEHYLTFFILSLGERMQHIAFEVTTGAFSTALFDIHWIHRLTSLDRLGSACVIGCEWQHARRDS